MKEKRLSYLFEKAKAPKAMKDLGLNERERTIIEAINRRYTPDELDRHSVGSFIREPSAAVPELDELRDLVRKMDALS